MVQRVAVVTGGNKGIGLALVKGLCERFNGEVYLTSRDKKKGGDAVKELYKLGYSPRYHQLDVTDKKSLKVFHDYIKSKYGGIDILINNAAIAFPKTSEEPLIVQAEETIFVNYYSLAATCEILFPLLRPHGRVINLSSALGHLSFIPSEKIQEKFGDKSLTEFKLNRLVNEFVKSVRRGTNVEDGWGTHAYPVSKVAVTALTFIHSRLYSCKGISINCYHPGYIATDMSQHLGPMTVEQGAETGLYLALQAPQNLKGQFLWYDNSIVSWYGPRPEELFIQSNPAVQVPLPVEIQTNPPSFTNDLLPGNLSTGPPNNALSVRPQIVDVPTSGKITVEEIPPPPAPLPADLVDDSPPFTNDLLPGNLSTSPPNNALSVRPQIVDVPTSGAILVEEFPPPPAPLPADLVDDSPTFTNDLLPGNLPTTPLNNALLMTTQIDGENTLPSDNTPVINMKNSLLKSSAVPQSAVLLD